MKGGRVVALRVPNGAKFSRKEIDEYTKFVGIYGAKGLAYIKVNDVSNLSNGEDSGLQSPIVKFCLKNALKGNHCPYRRAKRRHHLLRRRQSQSRERSHRRAAYQSRFWNTARKTATSWTNGNLVGRRFPNVRIRRRRRPLEQPCTIRSPRPKPGHEDLMASDPENCLARAYDMVLNGWEIGGGSIRIHRADVQEKCSPH